MPKLELKFPRGYDPRTQARIGLFVAQMDDQLKWLRKKVDGMTVKQLEWQPQPGMNTVGMLLAHIALAELWWIHIAPNETPWKPDGQKIIHKVCGFEDDGVPLPPDGKHCKFLKGYTINQYRKLLTKVRGIVRKDLKTWRDRDLDKMYSHGKHHFSHSWTIYHVLEHTESHFGQILMLQHMMRDAGVMKKPKKK